MISKQATSLNNRGANESQTEIFIIQNPSVAARQFPFMFIGPNFLNKQ